MPILMKPLRLLMLLMFVSVLAACGFHLKGSQQHSSSIQQINIQASSSAAQLKKALQQQAALHSIALHENANWTINLSNVEQESIRVTSTQSVSKDQFRIKITVRYAMRYSNNQLQERSITRQRLFNDDSDQPLSKQEERRTIVAELHQEIADTLIQQAQLLSINPPNCHCDKKP